jgi:energy-coupling factor transporter ATP-binding protein EcfA2
MSKVNVKLSNIGGLKSLNAELERGRLNVIRGTSSSGKSSLMRGLHLGVVGTVPHQDLYLTEVNALHLNDRNSDQALLHRGASEGTVEVTAGEQSFRSTIPRNGNIKSNASNPKGLFTTMLSSLPQTQIHQRVFNPDSDAPNDFKWVVDDFSDAGKYQTWHDVLARLEQELAQHRVKFNAWKQSLSDSSQRRASIEQQLFEVNARINAQAAESGVEQAELSDKIATLQRSVNQKKGGIDKLQSVIQEHEASMRYNKERIQAAEAQRKLAQRRLDDAEDLLEEGVIEPDISGFDDRISALEQKCIDAAKSEPNKETTEVMSFHQARRSAIQPPELLELLDKLEASFGDSGLLKALNDEIAGVRKERQDVINVYLDKKRRYGMAEQQRAAARAEIESANQNINMANLAMSKSETATPKQVQEYEQLQREFEPAKAELDALLARRDALGGVSTDDAALVAKLTKELSSIENTTTFDVRFSSLGMLASQTLSLSLSDAEQLLGTASDSKPNTGFVTTHLEKSASEIRSLLYGNLTSGILSSVEATSAWAREEADRQRQETRRVFNDVGSSLFKRLKFSQINGLQLDSDYEIKISWDGVQEPTGLTGAGGERTIIAATLLIAMRKAYTPDLPLLMFDGVLENLDDGPRNEFMQFLSEYAASEGVAVVVSLLDEKHPTPQIN